METFRSSQLTTADVKRIVNEELDAPEPETIAGEIKVAEVVTVPLSEQKPPKTKRSLFHRLVLGQ
jgi:hypothetical protein